jgi:hypothetical protein
MASLEVVGISMTIRWMLLVMVEEGTISNNSKLVYAGMLTEETRFKALNLGP